MEIPDGDLADDELPQPDKLPAAVASGPSKAEKNELVVLFREHITPLRDRREHRDDDGQHEQQDDNGGLKQPSAGSESAMSPPTTIDTVVDWTDRFYCHILLLSIDGEDSNSHICI